MMEGWSVQRRHEKRWGAVGFVLAGLAALCAAGRGLSIGPLTAGVTPVSAAQTAGTESAASSGGADGATASVSAGLPTLEQVQALRDKAAQAEAPDAEAKARLLETYDKTLAQLKLLAELQAKRAGFIQQQQAAPAEMEKAKGQLAAGAPAETPIPAGATASGWSLFWPRPRPRSIRPRSSRSPWPKSRNGGWTDGPGSPQRSRPPRSR